MAYEEKAHSCDPLKMVIYVFSTSSNTLSY